MTTTETCDCHKKHEEKFHVIEKTQEHRETELKEIRDSIDKKCPMSLFLFLVALMIANLGFQWSTYDKLKDLDKRIAVIETRLSDNARYCPPKL